MLDAGVFLCWISIIITNVLKMNKLRSNISIYNDLGLWPFGIFFSVLQVFSILNSELALAPGRNQHQNCFGGKEKSICMAQDQTIYDPIPVYGPVVGDACFNGLTCSHIQTNSKSHLPLLWRGMTSMSWDGIEEKGKDKRSKINVHSAVTFFKDDNRCCCNCCKGQT